MEEEMGWKGGMDGMDGGGEVLILGTADGKSSSGRQQQTATAAAGVAHTAHSNAFCMLCVWLPQTDGMMIASNSNVSNFSCDRLSTIIISPNFYNKEQWSKKKDTMVDIVAGRVTRVLDTLETFKSQWTPAIARQIELVRRVYNELLIDDDPEAELSVTAEVVLAQAMEKLGDMLQEMAHQHRSTHQMLSKIGRAIDRYFVTDLSSLTKIDKNIDTDPRLHGRVNALITNHLTSTGKFDVADVLTKEAQLPASEGLEFNVDDIRHLMEAFQKRDITPALQWLKQNASRDEQLIYDLQKQHFVKLLEDGQTMEALQYSRQLSKNPEEMMQLLWAVVAKDRKTRYPDLFNPVVWQQLELRLARVMSRSENYLSQILELGIKMVPSLISLRQLMVNRSLESLFQGDELPIEVDVPNATHSVFACPILKAQCTEQNPPMRLTCGHLISREALHKLAQTGRFVAPTNLAPSNAFSHIRLKCPYCPVESSVADAKRVKIFGTRLPPLPLYRHPTALCMKIICADKVFPA